MDYEKKCIFLILTLSVSLVNPLRGNVPDPYAPESGATWCNQSSQELEKTAQKSQKSVSKNKGSQKKILVITTLAVMSLLVVLGSSVNASQIQQDP
jgi:hypothetical protein